MDNPLAAALIAAFVAILCGSLSAAIVSHILTSYRSEKEYRLKKLEELFLAVQAWTRHLRLIFYYLSETARGVYNWEKGIGYANEQREHGQPHFATAKMVSNVYFSDLTHVVNLIEKFDIDMHAEMSLFLEQYLQGTANLDDYKTKFDRAEKRAKELRNEFNEKLYRAAADIRRGRIWTWLRNYPG